MERFELISIEWNCYNGLIVSLVGINDSALFGFNFGWEFLYIDIMFFSFKIYDKNKNQ